MIPETFHFLRPGWLAALAPIALILWTARGSAARTTSWRRVVDAHLLRHLLLAEETRSRRWPLWALATGWLTATVAMAGPTWEQIPQATWTAKQPTAVLLDLSPAMNVADLSPSRLARARHELHDVLERAKGGQVALVLYTGEVFVAAPLTDDGRLIAEMIPGLESGIMPGDGSRPDRAIEAASKLFEQAGIPGGDILLLTASSGDDPSELARAAAAVAAEGRRLSIIGLGTPEGGPLVDARGRMLRSSDGKPISSPVDVEGLTAAALAGAGRFSLSEPGPRDLELVLASAPPVAGSFERTSSSVQADTWRDAGTWLVLLPLALAPLAFRRGAIAALAITALLGVAQPSAASSWSDLWATRDQQAQAALVEGDAETAAATFEDPEWRAAAKYRAGAYGDAIAAYDSLPGSQSRYNLGNALARAGELERAVKAYDDALSAEPEHADAKFNRDLVQRLIDERKRQPQDQQQAGNQPHAQDQAQGRPHEQDGTNDREGLQQQAQDPAQDRARDAHEGNEEQGSADERATEHARAADSQPEPSSGDAKMPSDPDAREEQTTAAASGSNEQPDAPPSEPKEVRQATLESPEEAATARASLAKQIDRALERNAGDTSPPTGEPGDAPGRSRPRTEEEQAREQRLRSIPDDPGGLLRARIRRHFATQAMADD